MGSSKNKTFKDLDEAGKTKIGKASFMSLAITVIVCLVIVGCFACKQENTMPDAQSVMTDEQKVAYWTAKIMDVNWFPQTDDTHDGILKDLFLARDARTVLDSNTSALIIYFMIDEDNFLINASIELENEAGKLIFESEDQWDVRFSEKNEIMYMTITDSDGKTVYYQQK